MEGLSAQPRLWVTNHRQCVLKTLCISSWHLAETQQALGGSCLQGKSPKHQAKYKKDAMSTQGSTGPCVKHPLKASSINQSALIS